MLVRTLRFESRYRKHVHAVGSPVRRARKSYDDRQTIFSSFINNTSLRRVISRLRRPCSSMANVADSGFSMCQIWTFQCSKFANLNVVDLGYSFRDIRKNCSARFSLSNVPDLEVADAA